jgi:hypothetical protein
VHRHVRRDVEKRLGVVEDDLHAGADHLVGDLLRGVGRHGEDGDDDVLVADLVTQRVVAGDGRPADRFAALPGIAVERRRDVEPVIGEDRRAGNRLSQPARAEERDVVLALRPQDLPDLGDEAVDVVADAPLAELAEGGEVAADLRRVDVGLLADFLGGDALLPHLARLGEDSQILGEPRRDADRQAIAGPSAPLARDSQRHARPTQ